MRSWLFVLVFVMFPLTVFAQVSPCDPTQKADTVDPNRYYISISNFNTMLPDGVTPDVTDVQYALFANGATPSDTNAVQGPSTLPRSAFTAVTGFPGCYLVSRPAAIPNGQLVAAAFKTRRASPAAVSPWSPPSESFWTAPSVLATPGRPIPRRQ